MTRRNIAALCGLVLYVAAGAVLLVVVTRAPAPPPTYHEGYAHALDLARKQCELHHGTDPAIDWARLWVEDNHAGK